MKGAVPPPERRVIEPPRGLRPIDWGELYRYRDLFYFLVWRDVKVRYKQTVLGLTWALIPPVVSMLLFTVVFGRLADVPSDGIPYPLFSYTGVVPWTYLAASLGASTTSLVGNALLTKVYFPRVLVPVTPVLVGLLDLGVASLLIAPLMVWYGVAPTAAILWLPIPVLLAVLTAAGAGAWLAGLAVQYRDVKLAVGFLIQILMYAAPVVWPASLIEGPIRRFLYGLYPVAGVVEGFRTAIVGGEMPWDLLVPGSFSAVALFVSGIYFFRYKERVFADVL